MTEECKLCGGIGAVTIVVPHEGLDKDTEYSDCPCCIERIWTADEAKLKARITELERQLENERVRLSACGSAALGYFEGCKDEYKSASLDDVLRLRERADSLERQRFALVEALGKTASHIEAMMAHIEHKPQRFKEYCWSQAVAARAALASVKGEKP